MMTCHAKLWSPLELSSLSNGAQSQLRHSLTWSSSDACVTLLVILAILQELNCLNSALWHNWVPCLAAQIHIMCCKENVDLWNQDTGIAIHDRMPLLGSGTSSSEFLWLKSLWWRISDEWCLQRLEERSHRWDSRRSLWPPVCPRLWPRPPATGHGGSRQQRTRPEPTSRTFRARSWRCCEDPGPRWCSPGPQIRVQGIPWQEEPAGKGRTSRNLGLLRSSNVLPHPLSTQPNHVQHCALNIPC